MLVSRLVPLLVMGGIAFHSGGAIKERLAGALGVADKVVTKQRMVAILDAATLEAATGGDVDLNSPDDFRAFVRQRVRIKNNAKADPSLDQWGLPFRAEQRGQHVVLTSAGPDKAFGTKDDVKADGDIGDY